MVELKFVRKLKVIVSLQDHPHNPIFLLFSHVFKPFQKQEDAQN